MLLFKALMIDLMKNIMEESMGLTLKHEIIEMQLNALKHSFKASHFLP